MEQALRTVSDTDRQLIALTGNGTAITRLQLVIAAERMLGEGGIDRVPMHEIAVAAGQANRSAVQYHFGDREGLIRAIFAARMPAIEARERALLACVDPEALFDPRIILEIMFIPIAEQIDDEGRHSYARFLMQYVTRAQTDHRLRHPLDDDADPLGFVYSRLATVCGLSQERLMRRMYLQTLVFLGALIERDNARMFGRGGPPLTEVLGETLHMMTRSLTT